MCSFGGDYADLFDTHDVTARKWHRCSSCLGFIAPGEKYTRIFVLNDGNAHGYKSCALCEAASKDFDEHHEIRFADTWQALVDCAADDYDGPPKPPTEDRWRFWLWLLSLNARATAWRFGAELARSWSTQHG